MPGASVAGLRLSSVRETVSTLHDSIQLLIWALGGIGIVVALLSGAQLLPEPATMNLDLPDPRDWIKLEHPLFRWMFYGLMVVVAFSALFAVGSSVSARGARFRGELALIIACLTALAALLIARGLTDLAFGDGWSMEVPDFQPGWVWLKELVGKTLGTWLKGGWRWAAAAFYLAVIFGTLSSAKDNEEAAGWWLILLFVIPAAFVAWVLVIWPALKVFSNLPFYFAVGCSLFYVAHYGAKWPTTRTLMASAVLAVWAIYWVVEATSGT
jgi:hypothetical protein